MNNSLFSINQIVWDFPNKEFVKITNGTEVNGEFEPTEGVVLRVVGVNKNKITIGWTHKKIKSINNLVAVPAFDWDERFELILSDHEFAGVEKVGRV